MNARNIASISSLTPIQEGILFHAIADNARNLYHSQFSARLDGALDAVRWRAAWDQVIARHDALRTLFTWEGRDKPLQIVRERVDTPWQELDWSDAPAGEHAAMLEALFERDRDLGFELDRAPLLRLVLIRLGPSQHRFVLTFHHLILDGWSMRLILEQAQQIYARPDAPREPAPSFTRYVEWRSARDDSGDAAWWRERLGNFDTPVFPEVRDGCADREISHHVVTRELSPSQADTLLHAARAQRVTPNSVIAAAWALLLARYTGSEDIVFGTTVAGRPPDLDGVEHMAGMFINTLPLRLQPAPEASVADWLQQVQRAQVEQREMEPSSLSVAQRASGVAAGEALFETILVYENFPAAEDAPKRDISLSIDHFVEYSHFALAILAVPDDPFQLIGISDPSRMGEVALADLMDNLQHTVVTMLGDVHKSLSEVSTLDTDQRRRVIGKFNDTDVATPPATTLWQQIAAHAARAGQDIALIDAAGSTTYGALMTAANGLSGALLERDVAPGDPILVIGPRSGATVTAIIAVHGAGAAYVPVASDAPAARVAQIVGELQALGRPIRALITGANSVVLPDAVQRIEPGDLTPGTAEIVGPSLSSAAYYMFTSGSTGTPKGVEVSQRNLFHSVHARDHYYDDPPASFALLSTLATDSSVAGLFWTLGRGGTLVLPADRAEQDMVALTQFLARHQVTHLLTVPTLYGVLLEHAAGDDLASLEVAIVAGEACSEALVESHERAAPERQLHNEYGPTETTVWCSAGRLDASAPVTIGRPLANTRLYVLDARQRPVPVGVAGELYVGGPQVAQGYVGDPERTARHFVSLPFSDDQRLYRTGDRVRWARDGTLSFVGRMDDQIKVRGFRVEPGDIEAHLVEHDEVGEAAVLLHEGSTNTPLVAFVTATAQLDAQALRESLNERLPGYMVPQYIELLDTIPRTPAGKTDRRSLALRPLSKPEASERASSRPPTDTEEVLAAIWRDVLGIDEVGIHDDFFALGGDSLLSIRVLARAGKSGLRIAPADFFAWPTVAGQAAHADQTGARRVAQKPMVGPQPLMPIQQWFFDHIHPGRAHWNLSYRFDLKTPVTVACLQRAVAAVLTTHDALRSGFVHQDNQWHCRVHTPQEFDVVSQLDLTQHAQADIDAAVRRTADTLNASFDLAAPPLLRACLVHAPEPLAQQLVIVIHHLIVDAESWRIVIEDLELALQHAMQNKTVSLPEKTDALATFSKRLIAWSQEDAFAQVEQQWQARLGEPVRDLLPQHDAQKVYTEGQCQQHVVSLEADATTSLLQSTTDTRATTLELLLAGVASALGQHLNEDRVRFEIEGHGREAQFEDLDISRTVGWMTTAYPITVQRDDDWRDVSAVLRRIKSSLRDTPQRGLGYGVIMAGHGTSEAARRIREVPRAAVLFNYLGQRSNESSRLLQLADERCGQARATQAPRAYLLEMNAMIVEGRLSIHMVTPQPAFSPATIAALGDAVLTALRALAGGTENTVVPEDFPLANLDQQGLSDLSDLLDELDD